MPLTLWDQPYAHNIRSYPPLVALYWLQGGLSWVIQMLCVPFLVLWIHSFGGYIGGGSAVIGLVWGAGTCGTITIHILALIYLVFWYFSPRSI